MPVTPNAVSPDAGLGNRHEVEYAHGWKNAQSTEAGALSATAAWRREAQWLKHLIIVNGPPGVGKSTVCNALRKMIQPSVWMDGDWCWMMHPFRPLVTEANKRMVEQHIHFLLRSFLANPDFAYVIFSWVIPQENIFDIVLNPLRDLEFVVTRFTLICSPEVLQQRFAGDRERQAVSLDEAQKSLQRFLCMNTIQIDTSHQTATAVAQSIADRLPELPGGSPP